MRIGGENQGAISVGFFFVLGLFFGPTEWFEDGFDKEQSPPV